MTRQGRWNTPDALQGLKVRVVKLESDSASWHHSISRFDRCSGPRSFITYTRARRSRRAFAMTETELRLIAAAAIIGLRSQPVIG